MMVVVVVMKKSVGVVEAESRVKAEVEESAKTRTYGLPLLHIHLQPKPIHFFI